MYNMYARTHRMREHRCHDSIIIILDQTTIQRLASWMVCQTFGQTHQINSLNRLRMCLSFPCVLRLGTVPDDWYISSLPLCTNQMLMLQNTYNKLSKLWRCNSALFILWLYFCLGQNKWVNGQTLIHDHICKPFCTNSKKLYSLYVIIYYGFNSNNVTFSH